MPALGSSGKEHACVLYVWFYYRDNVQDVWSCSQSQIKVSCSKCLHVGGAIIHCISNLIDMCYIVNTSQVRIQKIEQTGYSRQDRADGMKQMG